MHSKPTGVLDEEVSGYSLLGSEELYRI